MKYSYYFDCNKTYAIKTYIAEVDGLDIQYRYSRDFLETTAIRNFQSVEIETNLRDFSLNELVVTLFDIKRCETKKIKKWLITTCNDAILELDYDEICDEDVPCIIFQLMYIKKLYSEGRDLLTEVVASIEC